MANLLPILLLGGGAALLMMGKKKTQSSDSDSGTSVIPRPGPGEAGYVPDPTEEQEALDAILGNFQTILRKTEPMALLTRLDFLDGWILASVDPPAKNGPYVGILSSDGGYRTKWGLSVVDVKNKIKAGK